MMKLRAWMQSRKGVYILMGLLFVYMLILNLLTPYIADDYVYRFSFADSSLNRTVADVVKSMYAHCFNMNGRVISHSLESLFLLMPKLVFDLCNAAVYVFVMYALYRICNFKRRPCPVLFLVIAMAFWYFMPVFGQVVLWQVGALNYLWGLAVGAAFLLPYIVNYVNSADPLPSGWMKVLFSAAALVVGMYTEVTSFVVILLGLLLIVISGATGRTAWKNWLWIPLGIALVGFLIMMQMPAEINAKEGEPGLAQLMKGFDTAAEMMELHLKWLCIIWGGCFDLGVYGKVRTERLVLSGLFAFGAVVGNFMLTVAAYYPERCLCTSCMLLILACGVVIPELKSGGVGACRACAGAALAVAFLFSLARGSYDIFRTYTDFTAREIIIAQAVQEGRRELALPLVHAHSQYSAFWDTKDLDTETANSWPNNQMAQYYGVSSITGY